MINNNVIENSYIYVPIDRTNAKDAIPVGEDILYSSLGKYTKHYPKTTYYYDTHLVLTNKGFAYIKEIPKYKPWYKVIYISKLPLAFHTRKGRRYFEIVRDKDHESKENYHERKKNFLGIFLDIYVNALKNRLEEIKKNPETCTKKELKNQQKKLPKLISRYSKWLEKKKKKL